MAKYPTLTLRQILPYIGPTDSEFDEEGRRICHSRITILTKVWNIVKEESETKVLFEGDVKDVSCSLAAMYLDSEGFYLAIRARYGKYGPYMEISVKESE